LCFKVKSYTPVSSYGYSTADMLKLTFLKSIVIGTGIRFSKTNGAVTDRYLKEINSVFCVLKSIKLRIENVFALSAKKTLFVDGFYLAFQASF
jgi:hypothetical protein